MPFEAKTFYLHEISEQWSNKIYKSTDAPLNITNTEFIKYLINDYFLAENAIQ